MTNLATEKPPYSIASMEEIRAIPWNGLNVVSTFSGCGGTCLGYEMAGYKILWASEFIPAAQQVYRLNHPDTFLDTRDIRQVTGQSILIKLGLKQGEVDILEGSPPCASFSTAGVRERYWGQVVKYSDTKQRVDDLFTEYTKLVDSIQPKVFVAENVYGLVRGTAKGYFKKILAGFRSCGYQVEAKLLDAAWLGVPQHRRRLFFIGVRNDLGLAPVFPKPWKFYYTLRDVMPWIVKLHKGYSNYQNIDGKPSPTIMAHQHSENAYSDDAQWVEAVITHDTGGKCSVGNITDSPAPTILASNQSMYIDRFAIGKEWDKLKPGEQSEKYFSLVKPAFNKPIPTITATGANLGAASVVHPTERRKFTIEELKLVSSFPADFNITGTFSQQWERIGRAVPPFMARAIAETIRDNILCKENSLR